MKKPWNLYLGPNDRYYADQDSEAYGEFGPLYVWHDGWNKWQRVDCPDEVSDWLRCVPATSVPIPARAAIMSGDIGKD